MTEIELRTRMESDWAWRVDEILDLQNLFARASACEDELGQRRKALVVMLYAHFEGFVKTSFAEYINLLNNESLQCDNVHDAIVAGAHHEEFRELRNPNQKSRIFSHLLPDDAKLYAFARDVEFMSKVRNLCNKPVVIPDSVIDTENNVKEIVLRKMLFRVGLDWTAFKNKTAELDRLLAIRNSVAHGDRRSPIYAAEYQKYRDCIEDVVQQIMITLTTAAREKQYLRPTGTAVTN